MQPIKVATYKDTPIFHDPNQKENTVVTCNKPKSIGYQGLLYIGENGVCTREDGSPHAMEKTEYYVSCFIVNESDPEKAVKLIEHMIELQEKMAEHLLNKARKTYERLQELGIESTYSHNLKQRKAFNHVVIGDLRYKITHHPEGHYTLGHSHLFDRSHKEYAQTPDLKSIIEKILQFKKDENIDHHR